MAKRRKKLLDNIGVTAAKRHLAIAHKRIRMAHKALRGVRKK